MRPQKGGGEPASILRRQNWTYLAAETVLVDETHFVRVDTELDEAHVILRSDCSKHLR